MNNYSLPIIIDVEASGFGFNSYPIEIGLALEDGSTRCFLIKPEPSWVHWTNEGEELHGISRDTLNKHGLPVSQVCSILNELLDGKIVYSDGWSYDQSWLNQMFVFAKQTLHFRIETITYLLDPEQVDTWSSVKDEILKKYQFKRHRASNDALLLQRTFTAVQDQVS